MKIKQLTRCRYRRVTHYLRRITYAIFAVVVCASIAPVRAAATSETDIAHFRDFYAALNQHAPQVNLAAWNYTYKEAYSALEYAISACPELYYCDYNNSLCYSYNRSKAAYLQLSYDEQRAANQPAIDDAVEELVSSIDSSEMADWEIALAVHDAIISCTQYAYDWYLDGTLSDHPDVYDIDGVFGKGLGVCSGYSKAYMYILNNYYGIDCVIASSEQRNHAWNLVKINGAWYHVDLTHDDPVWDKLGKANHELFLLNDEELLQRDPVRSDYIIKPNPMTTYCNADSPSLSRIAFWAKATTNCCYYRGVWYYIDSSTRTINRYCPSDNSKETILSLPNNEWRVFEKPGWHWSECYSKLLISGATLYFSTATDIRAYNVETGSTWIVHKIDGSHGLIYGFGLTKNGVGYAVRTTPTLEGFEPRTDLDEHMIHTWGPATVEQAATYSTNGTARCCCEVCSEKMSKAFRIERPVDVCPDVWYDDAVEWALGTGIVSGTGNGTFSPEASCTRAQMIVMLWRYFGCPKTEQVSNPFADVPSEAYYADAVLWAVGQGIVQGESETVFRPNAKCSRAQAVTLLYRALSPECGTHEEDPYIVYEDVDYTSWYGPAIAWAFKVGIANGTGNCQFAPNELCSRAQIVTMLQRADRVCCP